MEFQLISLDIAPEVLGSVFSLEVYLFTRNLVETALDRHAAEPFYVVINENEDSTGFLMEEISRSVDDAVGTVVIFHINIGNRRSHNFSFEKWPPGNGYQMSESW